MVFMGTARTALLTVCVAGWIAAASAAGAGALNLLDITFVMSKLASDFTLAVRIARLISTSVSTELLVNSTVVDQNMQRKLLWNSIQFARPSQAAAQPSELVFATATGWNVSDNKCEAYFFHNHNSSWFTRAQPGPTWLVGIGRRPTSSTQTGARPNGESTACDHLTEADGKFSSIYQSTRGLNGSGCMRFWAVDDVGKPQDLLFYYPYSPCNRAWFTMGMGGYSQWTSPFVLSEGFLGMTYVQPIRTPGYSAIAGVSACYILLTSIDDWLQATFSEDGLLLYIIDDDTGELIAASEENVAMIFMTKSFGPYSFAYPSRVTGVSSSNSNVREAEAFLGNGTKAGAGNKTIFVYDFSDLGLSWIQSAKISSSNGFDTVGTKWNLNWRVVAIQSVDCPGGSRTDAASGEPSASGSCQSCALDGPTYTSYGGAVHECRCIYGYYTDRSKSCKVCPTGARCTGGADPLPEAGWWRDTAAPGNDVFLECKPGRCLGCSTEKECELNVTQCSHGFRGRACALPSEDFYLVGDAHHRCDAMSVHPFFLTAMLYVSLACVWIFVNILLVMTFDSVDLTLKTVQNLAIIYVSLSFHSPQFHSPWPVPLFSSAFPLL